MTSCCQLRGHLSAAPAQASGDPVDGDMQVVHLAIIVRSRQVVWAETAEEQSQEEVEKLQTETRCWFRTTVQLHICVMTLSHAAQWPTHWNSAEQQCWRSFPTKHRCQRLTGAGGNVEGSQQSLGIVLSGPQTSVQHLTTIHLKVDSVPGANTSRWAWTSRCFLQCRSTNQRVLNPDPW